MELLSAPGDRGRAESESGRSKYPPVRIDEVPSSRLLEPVCGSGLGRAGKGSAPFDAEENVAPECLLAGPVVDLASEASKSLVLVCEWITPGSALGDEDDDTSQSSGVMVPLVVASRRVAVPEVAA